MTRPNRRALDATVYDRRPCNHSGMNAAANRNRLELGRLLRRGHPITPRPPAVEHTDALGLNELDLEAILVAVDDRLDLSPGPDERARLARGRAALELELGRLLAR